jgi:tRNA (mo5U34)-methyltransferase
MANNENLKTLVNSRPWFHRIDCGNGIITPGIDDSPNKLKALGMPEDLSGKTVLDIGAWDGFFSFEAESRGAIVTANDSFCWNGTDMRSKEGFDIAKTARRSKVKELNCPVENLSDAELEPFDIVLFLGVLYHAPDPLGYLKIVRSLTKGFAIIETHVDLLNVPVPACAYYPGDMLSRDPTNFFGPNELAVHGMCADAGFSKVLTLAETFMKNRRIFHAFA